MILIPVAMYAWGCGIEMYPSAWQKGSKKRPSFNKMPGKEHINCDADAESTVVKQGRRKASVAC